MKKYFVNLFSFLQELFLSQLEINHVIHGSKTKTDVEYLRTNHLRSLLVKLVTDNIIVDGSGFRVHTIVKHTV